VIDAAGLAAATVLPCRVSVTKFPRCVGAFDMDQGLPSRIATIARFGTFELDLQSGDLRKQGLKVRLADQPFQVLRVLLEHHGDVVTREELRGQLWSGDTFVDFDVGLNSAIRKLRDALGDSADSPTFVETLPRRGYRFIASVEAVTSGNGQVTEPSAAHSPFRARRIRIGAVVLLAATTGLVIIGAGSRLTSPRAAAPARIRSIVVLPLENLTADPAQEYFVDGMTDALITALAQAGTFDVISKRSSSRYKGTKKPSADIARELDVDAVVEGAASLSGEHVRFTAKLIRPGTDRYLWARSYDRELGDVVVLQGEIARAIAAAIEGKVASPTQARPARGPVNPEAYDLYLKGISATNRLSYEALRTAVAYFEQAVAKQPDFALGHARLAVANTTFLWMGPLWPDQVLPKAEAAARRALEIDDTVWEAHNVLALTRSVYGDVVESERETRRTEELRPRIAEAHGMLPGQLRRAGRLEEVVEAAEHGRKLDPLSVDAAFFLAISLRRAGHSDRAIAELRKALEIDPTQARLHHELGVTCVLKGDLNAGIAALEDAVKFSRRNPRFVGYLGYAYARAGRRREALKLLEELDERRQQQQYVSAFQLALIRDALGEREPARAALETAHQEHALEFTQLEIYPSLRSLALSISGQTFDSPTRAAPGRASQ
jgi:TolB-like protein/DNA-binding winged helix-turn-helix (wHTH) protein/Flp pilus assembly protein TadD